MSKHLLRSGPPSGRRRFRAAAAMVAVGALSAAALSIVAPASGTTTVTGGDPGTNPPVVRDSAVTVTADVSALNYYKTASVATIANAVYAASSLNTLKALALTGQLCRGNNPTGVNDSARTVITVTDPSNNQVATATSPVRDVSLFGSGAPLATQPVPSNTNYLGDYTGTSTTHGMSLSLNMTGKPSGTYTVKTSNYNVMRYRSTGAGGITSPCVVGVPDPLNGNKSVIPGPVETTTTFIYRPWQEEFTDVFGNGNVQANVIPRENKFKVGTQQSPIYAGTPENTKFYALPSASSFSLPSDPAACVANPASCLPSAAVQCEPGPGCTPRIMVINEPIGKAPTAPNGLVGVFDLDTQAFIALAKMNGSQRTLTSLGTTLDAQLKTQLQKLATAAAARGIDLNTLLATKVKVNNGQYEIGLSLLNALQIDPSTSHGGIQIVSDATAQAGLILGIYLDLVPNTCATKSATNSSADPRFTPSVPYGWNVEKSDVLPNVPAVGPLGTIAGGPVFHIFGKMRTTAQGGLIDTFSAVLGVDTLAGEPNGYPVWIQPFVAAGAIAEPRSWEFVGTSTWSASETSLGVLGCLVTDFALGTGVAVYNNPLPISLGTLLGPLYKPSAAGAQLNAAVSAALAQATDPVTTNPTVAALLAQILAALPV